MSRLWLAPLLGALAARQHLAEALKADADPMSLQRGHVRHAVKSDLLIASQAAECKKQEVEGWRAHTKDMDMLRDHPEWGKKQPRSDPPKPGEESVKMAFLILAGDRIENEEIWLHWMEQARSDKLDFSVFVHSSADGLLDNSSAWRSEGFRENVLSEQAETSWCQTWEAQMALLRRGLLDTHVTHFVVLSGDSVPVKPMAWIYNQTRDEPLSRFCADDVWRDPWPRAEAWSVLRRGDAMFFQQNKAFAEANFRKGCEDQLAWYFPLRVRWDNFPSRAPLKRECIMFANWKDGKDTCQGPWADSAESCGCPALRRSAWSTPAGVEHPAAYHDVSKQAFEELVRSPFWFARKFTKGAVPAEFKTVLNIDLAAKHRKRFKLFR